VAAESKSEGGGGASTVMIKLVNILVRDDELTHEAFVDYWFQEHAPLARDLPGLKRYVTGVPKDPEETDYDGIVELYFEDTAAMHEAMSSETGKQVRADAASFSDPEAGPTMVVDETVQLDEVTEG
jgi:uncharacterized protein (TIGR02118 family)